MRVKKMLLPAIVALGLAAPASASATETWWYDHDNVRYPTELAKKEVTPDGSLSITLGADQFGPCTYQFAGFIWGKAMGMGEGTISTKESVEACPATVAGSPMCTVTKGTIIDPLSLTLMTSSNVRVSGIKIELHLSPACPAPLTRTATGTVEGQFVAPVKNEKGEWASKTTVKFSKAAGLTVGGVAATLDGTLQFGTHITAVPRPALLLP